jgi:hypothetical protein
MFCRAIWEMLTDASGVYCRIILMSVQNRLHGAKQRKTDIFVLFAVEI